MRDLVTAGWGCGVLPASAMEMAVRRRKSCGSGKAANATALSKGTRDACKTGQVGRASSLSIVIQTPIQFWRTGLEQTQVSCATAACSAPMLHALPGQV